MKGGFAYQATALFNLTNGLHPIARVGVSYAPLKRLLGDFYLYRQRSTMTTQNFQPPMIGPHQLPNQVILAPMAGVTDRPFRQLCRRLGAGWVVGKMVTADPSLWHTRKSKLRMDHQGEPDPRVVQIAGGDAEMLANAARLNAELGAQVIDINIEIPG